MNNGRKGRWMMKGAETEKENNGEKAERQEKKRTGEQRRHVSI